MRTIEETIAFIQKAHAGQTDKAGVAYANHPIAVMHSLPEGVSDDVKCAALLHDVLEDTSYTRADLENMGYTATCLNAVEAVTKKDGTVPYIQAIQALIDSQNAEAILVKYADMTQNRAPERLALLAPNTRSRLEHKYRTPYALLSRAVEELGYKLTNEA